MTLHLLSNRLRLLGTPLGALFFRNTVEIHSVVSPITLDLTVEVPAIITLDRITLNRVTVDHITLDRRLHHVQPIIALT